MQFYSKTVNYVSVRARFSCKVGQNVTFNVVQHRARASRVHGVPYGGCRVPRGPFTRGTSGTVLSGEPSRAICKAFFKQMALELALKLALELALDLTWPEI